MNRIQEYYNKFNEEKRLDTRHGSVEYRTSMKYIHEGLAELSAARPAEPLRILDVGAGTGRYSVPLSEEGYDVTAVELVRHNLGILKAKGSAVKAYEGNALKLKRFSDESFDAVILFGPLYHLHAREDKLAALLEAKRVVRRGGLIFAAYIMNEYSVLTYAFRERHILEAREQGMLDGTFRTQENANELYSYMRVEDIDELNREAGLSRRKLIAADGAANYMRPVLNALTEEEFELFLQYHLATCERGDLVGASAHTVDILTK
jgi:ubiquinone/menaquinone biosynthesis C-methylase UbiE